MLKFGIKPHYSSRQWGEGRGFACSGLKQPRDRWREGERFISTERQQSPSFSIHANARWVESSGRDLVPALPTEDAAPGPQGILLLFSSSPGECDCACSAVPVRLCLCGCPSQPLPLCGFINAQVPGTPTETLKLGA